jgi:hypothetical protein
LLQAVKHTILAATREATLPGPLQLTDQQMDAVLHAARPLAPAFLERVAQVLSGHETPLGDGTVFRICRDVQAQFPHPPEPSGSADFSVDNAPPSSA